MTDSKSTPPFDIGAFGPALIWSEEVDAGLVQRANELGAKELSVAAAAPNVLGSIESLAEISDLVGLRVGPRRRFDRDDWAVLESCAQLRYVTFNHEAASGLFDVSRLPGLEWLELPWWKGLRGLESVAPRGLRLDRFDADSNHLDVDASRLVALTLVRPHIRDLRCLGNLQGLASLVIHGSRHLESANGLEALQGIEEVSFEACPRLEDIDAVSECRGLERVMLEDCARVRRFRRGPAQELKAVWITGTTVVREGGLGWLDACESLVMCAVSRRPEHDVNFDVLPSPDVRFAYPRIPHYEYRPPAVRRYSDLLKHTYAREHCYPAWFRTKHPELCLDADGVPLPRP